MKFAFRIKNIDQLSFAPYNPPNRVMKKRFKRLIDSIDLLGILYPILIRPDGSIIDGHRRVSAAKELRWKDVPCQILDREQEEVYQSVNDTGKRFTENDYIFIWLNNYRAVPYRVDKKFRKIRDEIGVSLIRQIQNQGLSLRVVTTARKMINYCGFDPNQLKDIVKWIIKYPVIGAINRVIKEELDKTILTKPFQSDDHVDILRLVG